MSAAAKVEQSCTWRAVEKDKTVPLDDIALELAVGDIYYKV